MQDTRLDTRATAQILAACTDTLDIDTTLAPYAALGVDIPALKTAFLAEFAGQIVKISDEELEQIAAFFNSGAGSAFLALRASVKGCLAGAVTAAVKGATDIDTIVKKFSKLTGRGGLGSRVAGQG